MKIYIIFEKINEACIYVYELLNDKVVKVKEGLEEYILNDKIYLFKCIFNENDYQLLLFNLRQSNLFYESKSKLDIERNLRKYNETIYFFSWFAIAF